MAYRSDCHLRITYTQRKRQSTFLMANKSLRRGQTTAFDWREEAGVHTKSATQDTKAGAIQ